MNYLEMQEFEKTVKMFIKQHNRKKSLMFRGYQKGKNNEGNYSWLGYTTDEGHLYGIHFRLEGKAYYFGERGKNTKFPLAAIPYYISESIPEDIKRAFEKAAISQQRVILPRNQGRQRVMDE